MPEITQSVLTNNYGGRSSYFKSKYRPVLSFRSDRSQNLIFNNIDGNFTVDLSSLNIGTTKNKKKTPNIFFCADEKNPEAKLVGK